MPRSLAVLQYFCKAARLGFAAVAQKKKPPEGGL
jgi:hypothetical protein